MNEHKPVLLQEAINALNLIKDGVYIDGTFGRGGHSKAILDSLGPNGKLIAFDKDILAIEYAEKHFNMDERFCVIHTTFADITKVTKEKGVFGKVNGILLDLGVSSPQLDTPSRGFSFTQLGPLDMRMDLNQSLTAASFVNNAKVSEMEEVFREFGEERFAKRIARAIEARRLVKPIETTLDLAQIVKDANPKWEKHKHPATRVFQAIRIFINRELADLDLALKQCVDVLAPRGRLAVISFHSLEDRIVKRFMQEQEMGNIPPKGIPIKALDIDRSFIRIGRAIKPHGSEVDVNIRARSAILRIGEKLK